MRVLITGGTGFIGARVAGLAAARGHEVHVLARHPDSQSGYPLLVHDLATAPRLAQALRGFDAVIHCAASLHGGLDDQRTTTVGGTANLVGAMNDAGVRRMILVSSFAVYDFTALRPGDVLTEDASLDLHGTGRAPYVTAKRQQEQIVTTGRAGLQWTIVRPGLVFGPGRTWFYDLGMRLPRLWVTLAGRAAIPLTHVSNCAAAIVAALDEPRSIGETVNIVDDQLPARSQYVSWLAARQAQRPMVLDVPWSMLEAASRGARMVTHGLMRDRIMPPGSLHPAVLAARCKPLRYDNSRARRVLGWAPMIGVEEALRGAGPEV